MTVREEIATLLKQHGAVLERQRKHQVWRFPDGRIYVQASTPSDSVCNDQNDLCQLRRMLGITRETNKNPQRRTKRGAPRGPVVYEPIPIRPARVKGLANLRFRSLVAPKYRDCFPVRIQRVPMTPVWAILLHLFGWPA